jgi:hypothetical protein
MSSSLKTKHAYEVRVALPEGATIGNMEAYIRNALKAECGNLSPDDPLFNLNRNKIKVVYKGQCPNGAI